MATATLTSPTSQRFAIRTLSPALGAEVVGVDLGQPLTDEDFRTLHRAHLRHHVLVFRDQHISPAQHVAFSARFGPLQRHVLHQFALPAHPDVLIVSNIVENGKPIGLGDAGVFWHSDLSYKERPSLGSFLHAQELPESGGDTLFANQHLALDMLPVHLAGAVANARAEHSYLKRYEELRARSPWRPALSAEQIAQVRPVAHPVIRTHPENRRGALFVNEHFTTHIIGLPRDESDAILGAIFAHATKNAFVYRHAWQPHDLVFWDNRSVQHLATPFPSGQRRKLFRTTIEGDVPA